MVGVWTRLQKKVGSEDPASLLDQVYLGCTQRAARRNPRIVENRTSFESVVFAGIAHAPLGKEQATTNTSCDMEAHAKKRVQHYCGRAGKEIEQFSKSLTPCVRALCGSQAALGLRIEVKVGL